MNGSRERRNPGPQVVAAVASSAVVVGGAAVATYFVQVRGTGFAAMVQSGGALDFAVAGAVLIVTAIGAHVAVARGVAAARTRESQLLRQALEADWADPDALHPFEGHGPLRDLVASLVAEKSQVRELQDRLETSRGELLGLADGFQRSIEDLGAVRADGLSPAGHTIVTLWNHLAERTAVAERERANAEGIQARTGPGAASPDVAALVARLDELEGELHRLRVAVDANDRMRGTESVALRAESLQSGPMVTESLRSDPLRSEPGPAERSFDRAATPLAATPWPVRSHEPTPVQDAAEWGDVQPVEPLPRTRTWSAPAAGSLADAFASTVREDEDVPFPPFVVRPGGPIPERVEVTYEGQTGEDVLELPASAMLFEPEDEGALEREGVFDLRSLGAEETER